VSIRYEDSTEFLTRAELVIPLGSQTFSKSRTQYPVGVSPLFAVRAKGPHLWDLDGNKYIDLVSNLAAVTLGYRFREVETAVRKQMKLGNGFSLPSTLETIVAERIVSLVPSAEMVRFGKNGTDATSAAVRLARAYTGRDCVAVCGYHGWQDWFIGSTSRNKGVPAATSQLTVPFQYNNIQSLAKIFMDYPNKVAAVILEPMTSEFPTKGFLQEIKNLCEKNGTILIFDETITGFRFTRGGAQELFQVSPHLSTFGKGIANGYPLSVVCGRKEIMKEMENIFFSGTFGGELLSLAAANVVLAMHQRNTVSPNLFEAGEDLSNKLQELIIETEMTEVLKVKGHATWKFLDWSESAGYSPLEIRTFFMQEMFRRGLLILGTHNVSLAHNTKTRKKILETYSEVLSLIRSNLVNETLRMNLRVKPLQPLFRVR
jgi:glutamate-1-semialdehyde 2,1-aminomutase